MKTLPTNMDDIIDSRDVIARIEELEAELPVSAEDVMPGTSEELAVLKALAEDGEGSPDWAYGEILIRDTYFRDYAQELAEDCCEIPNADQWPQRCIDWEQAARELEQDYLSVSFDGIDYWIRT